MEFHRVVEIVGAGERDEVAALGIAEVDVSIGELERDITIKLVGETGMQRPREIPFAGGAAKGVAASAAHARRTVHADRDVAEVADRVAAEADTGADEWRDVPPGAEVNISVEHEGPFGLAGGITVVREAAAGNGANVETMEIRRAPVFTGEIEPQPVVDGVTNAEAEQRRRVEALVDILYLNEIGVVHIEEAANILIAEADIAAQIPA